MDQRTFPAEVHHPDGSRTLIRVVRTKQHPAGYPVHFDAEDNAYQPRTGRGLGLEPYEGDDLA